MSVVWQLMNIQHKNLICVCIHVRIEYVLKAL